VDRVYPFLSKAHSACWVYFFPDHEHQTDGQARRLAAITLINGRSAPPCRLGMENEKKKKLLVQVIESITIATLPYT
jgi:hypothetical protein